MKHGIVALLLVGITGCAISTGPLAPEGDPTPSGAETEPAPNPVAGTVVTTEPDIGGELQNARQTMDRMGSLAAALRAYHSDNGSYPVASSARQLVQILSPRYVESLEPTDAWGQPLRYERRNAGQSYVLVSTGSDREADLTTWDADQELTDPVEDIVIRDGQFTRTWPRE